MPEIKIAIIHDFLLKLGGAEKVLLELLEIFPEAHIYTLLYDEKGTNQVFTKFNITHSYLQKKSSPPRNFKFLLPYFPKAIESFDLSEYDLVISLSNSFAHGVITSPKCLHICYCMSPTRYLYDWKDEYLAENGLNKGLKGLAVKKILSDIRIWDQEASKRPDRYIAISKHVQNRLRKYYRVDSDIVYPPTHVEEFSPHFGLPEDYYIIISRLSAYKKIDLAIEAFNKTKDNLIIIGAGEDEKRLKKLANNNIEFLGWQSDEASREYLRYAKALIFPGEEDFGLTPVEAMASGRPVIAYNRGGVTETVRDGKDGVFFDQPTSNSLIEALNRFDMMAKTLNSKEICQHAEKFSFDTFKEQFLKKVNEYAKTC